MSVTDNPFCDLKTEDLLKIARILCQDGENDCEVIERLLDLIGTMTARLRELLHTEEEFKKCVEAAAPFQVDGDLHDLLKIGDHVVVKGLELGITALRNNR